MYLDKAYIIVKRNVEALLRNKQKYKYTNNMQVMLMRLMSKGQYLIVPKGTKFTGSGKLGLNVFLSLSELAVMSRHIIMDAL